MAKHKRAKETHRELLLEANAVIDAARAMEARGWTLLDRVEKQMTKAGLNVSEALNAAGMIG
jgi:hypothetical protein